MDIERILLRLDRALATTSWRWEFGQVDPSQVAAAEAALGVLPADFRVFLARVVTLENRTGDVFFATARDYADKGSETMRRVAARRHADELTAGPWAESMTEVRAFWTSVVPFLFSLINGEDALAIDRERNGAVVALWNDTSPCDPRRACASSFGHLLDAFTTVVERGPTAFDAGWRLARPTLDLLHGRDPNFRDPLLPLLFNTDFVARNPISWPPPSISRDSSQG